MPEPTTPSRPQVLVVDSARTVRDEMAGHLADAGCGCIALDAAARCIEVAAEQQPLAIFLDYEIGSVRGDEVCRELKADARTAKLPVLMLTSATAAHEIMYSWRAGADDFLPKPIKPPQVSSKIRALVAGTQHVPSARQWAAIGRVMLVDDSRFYRNTLGDALEHSGLELIYAKNGQEALRALERASGPLDTIICDIAMPKMDGLTFLRELRSDPKRRGIKVLMCSGLNQTPQMRDDIAQLTAIPVLDKRQLTVEQLVAQVLEMVRPGADELRSNRRVPFFSIVEYCEADGDVWNSGFSYNISQGGIFVRTLTGLPQRAAVKLKFSLGPLVEVEGRGIVAWSNPFRPRTTFTCPVGMGVRFTELPRSVTDELARLVQMTAI
jgi:two-component system cell cycle response regulator